MQMHYDIDISMQDITIRILQVNLRNKIILIVDHEPDITLILKMV
jgi:hypothetical protein